MLMLMLMLMKTKMPMRIMMINIPVDDHCYYHRYCHFFVVGHGGDMGVVDNKSVVIVVLSFSPFYCYVLLFRV